MNLKDKNILISLFPELQVYNCINKFGFTEKAKIIKEGKVYVNDKISFVKNKSYSSDINYGKYVVIYIYLFFLSLLSLLVFFSPVYFVLDIKRVLFNGLIDNTCLVMFYEVGILAGFAMIIPVLRKIYDILPWMFIFIKIVCFDLLIMGLSIKVLDTMVNLKILSILFMLLFLTALRFTMCMLFKKYNYISQKDFKLFGGIIFSIGIVGIIFL